MKVVAICNTCCHQHLIDFDPKCGPGNAFSDWNVKHHGHDIEYHEPTRTRKFLSSKPQHKWLDYIHNANVKVAYSASSSVLSAGLNSLAASSTLLAGYESNAITNAVNLYLDAHSTGFFKSAASNNQAGTIYSCVVGAQDATPTWPDVFDGTASVETVSKSGVFNAVCKIAAAISADNTASQVWPYGPVSVASLFGGNLPVQWVYFITQNIQTSTNGWFASGHNVEETYLYLTVV